MMVMRFDIDPAAFAAFDDGAMRIVVGYVDEQFRLADAAAVSLVAAAFAQGRSCAVRFDLLAGDIFGIDNHHVELRHIGLL